MCVVCVLKFECCFFSFIFSRPSMAGGCLVGLFLGCFFGSKFYLVAYFFVCLRMGLYGKGGV